MYVLSAQKGMVKERLKLCQELWDSGVKVRCDVRLYFTQCNQSMDLLYVLSAQKGMVRERLKLCQELWDSGVKVSCDVRLYFTRCSQSMGLPGTVCLMLTV